jgi:hypothetical protein
MALSIDAPAAPPILTILSAMASFSTAVIHAKAGIQLRACARKRLNFEADAALELDFRPRGNDD